MNYLCDSSHSLSIIIMSVVGRITFSHIRDVINGLGKNTRPPLGRWLLKKDTEIATVVKYANEDHCGTCTTYENTEHFTPYKHSEETLFEIEYSYISVNTQH